MYVVSSSSRMAALDKEEGPGEPEEGSGVREIGVMEQQDTQAMNVQNVLGVASDCPCQSYRRFL